MMIELVGAWSVIILTYVVGVVGWIPNNFFFASMDQVRFYVNVVNILLVIMCVPLSMKLFSLNTQRSLLRMNKDEALQSYHQWSILRLVLLVVCALLGIIAYFMFTDSTGLLCAVISFVSTLFCIPSSRKVQEFLDTKQEEKLEDISVDNNPSE